MKIATLNINSINARLDNLTNWISENSPDVMLLQEIKTEYNHFPFFDLQLLGYEAKILGQKGYNGVAILSKHKIVIENENLPNYPDKNARYLETKIKIDNIPYIISSIYLPNGNPPYNNPEDTSKLQYKLEWMDAFIEHAQHLIENYTNIILAGDFNVILSPKDVYDFEKFRNNALCHPNAIKKLNKLSYLGYCDVYRNLYTNKPGYTYWDYTSNALFHDLGMRIDYIYVSPKLADKIAKCDIDITFRKQEKSSDHTILSAEFND